MCGSSSTTSAHSRRLSEILDYDDHLIPLSLTETQRRPTHLEKEVTFWNGVSLVVGLMIGSGIFASPGPVAEHAGSVGMSLMVWLACGLLACTGALSYAELGAEIPLSGGDHAYLSHAYGSLPAFLFSWTAITCLKPGSNAIIAMIFAEYINRIIYHTAFEKETDHPSNETHQWFNKIMASFCILIVSFINVYSVRLATRTQDFFTLVKLIALAVIAIIGFVVLGKGGITENFEGDLFADSSETLGDYALAFYSGLWAYDGWNNVNFVAGEMKNPSRDLPRVIMLGLPMVIVFYLLANVAYYAVLPSNIVKNTNTIALDFGKKIFGATGGLLFALCVAASCFGAVNGSIFTGGRVIYVASREGYLPSVFGKVHPKWNTPTAALAMQASLTILMILAGTFATLVNFYSVAAWVFYFLTSFGLLILRWREPDLPRPYRVWITTPIIFCCVAVFLVVMPFIRVPLESLAALGFISAGVPFWIIRVKHKDTFSIRGFKNSVTNISQRLRIWRTKQEYRKQETVEMT
ncbi:6668_t:CDS:2 [Ambispora gerdemannii]|uniref:6668_t:CDS:1 n=1 Tax=Ambispora gerdemannii TaxID=144530 RepID=A0A9N8W7G2_9GLOM|nr:6668_t:CDS:2 [Ambispora gerdemannii]